MNKNLLKKIIIGLTILIVILILYVYVFSNKSTNTNIDFYSTGQSLLSKYSYSEAAYNFKLGISKNASQCKNYFELAKIYDLKNLRKENIDLLENAFKSCDDKKQALLENIKYNLKYKEYGKVLAYTGTVFQDKYELDEEYFDYLALARFNAFVKDNQFEGGKSFIIDYYKTHKKSNQYIAFVVAALKYDEPTVAKNYITDLPDYTKYDLLNSVYIIQDAIEKDQEKNNYYTNLANLARLMIKNSNITDTKMILGVTVDKLEIDLIAINILDKIIAQSPEYYVLYSLRGIAKFQQLNYPKAKEDFLKSDVLYADYDVNLYYLARLSEIESDIGGADKYYQRLLELNTSNTNNLIVYIDFLVKNGFNRQASERYDFLFTKLPESTESFKTYVNYLEFLVTKVQKYTNAIAVINKLDNQWQDKFKPDVSSNQELYEKYGYFKAYTNYIVEDNDLSQNSKKTNEKFIELLDKHISSFNKVLKTYSSSARTALILGDLEYRYKNYLTDQAIINKHLENSKNYYQKAIDLDINDTITSTAKDKLNKF